MKASSTIWWRVVALLCFIQISVAVKRWTDLRVRYSLLKSRGFHQIPLSTNISMIQEYVKVVPESDFKLPLDFYCLPDDPRACFMFDKKGNIAGVQTSFLKSDVAGVDPKHYDYSMISNYKKTNFFNNTAYSFRVYFTNPEKLTNDGRQNVKETAEGVWVYLGGKLFEVPKYQPSTDYYEGFYKQGCLRSMGVHYFHDVTTNVTNCQKIFPFFALYEDGYLVGYGLAGIGKGSTGTRKDWYERPPRLALTVIIPHRPACIDHLASTYGTTSMHVYLVERPWDISCNFFDNVINMSTDWIPV